MTTIETPIDYAARCVKELGQKAHETGAVLEWCHSNPPTKPTDNAIPQLKWIKRMEEFASLNSALVRGVTRAIFHSDHLELVWSKYEHTIAEQQAVAREHRHLEWRIVRSDNGQNLDWLCDFGDVLVRLQAADVMPLRRLPALVDFDALPILPTLQPQEEAS